MNGFSKKRCVICACGALVLLLMATVTLFASADRSEETENGVPVQYIGTPVVSSQNMTLFGRDGYYEESGEGHIIRTYYLRKLNGKTDVPAAESFGFGIDDRTVDLDGDGVDELVCSCTFGGDGARRVYVYRLSGDTVERGMIDEESMELPDFFDWGVNAVQEYYDSATGDFVLEYATRDGVRTVHCEYEDFTFAPYQPQGN